MRTWVSQYFISLTSIIVYLILIGFIYALHYNFGHVARSTLGHLNSVIVDNDILVVDFKLLYSLSFLF